MLTLPQRVFFLLIMLPVLIFICACCAYEDLVDWLGKKRSGQNTSASETAPEATAG